MRATTSVSEGTLEIAVSGDLDLRTEQELVMCAQEAFGSADVSRAVLDVTAVEFIDSSGLRALLRCRTSADNHGLPLQLRVGESPVARLIDLAGVTPWFDQV